MNLDNEITMAIENQEKRGQSSMISNRRLPKKTNYCSGYQNQNDIDFTKKQYEKMGIEIVDDYDDLFWSVKLPKGWQIKPTSHPMWNEVFDDKGRKRATFFYKAAFYDRDAFTNFETRYTICVDHIADSADYNAWRKSDCCGFVKDCDKVIYSTKTKPSYEDYSKQENEVEKPLRKELETYMAEHYPNYKDVNAYWDD